MYTYVCTKYMYVHVHDIVHVHTVYSLCGFVLCLCVYWSCGVQDYLLPPVDSIDRYLAEDTVKCIVQSHYTNRKEWLVCE